jgi:hypothetical protein
VSVLDVLVAPAAVGDLPYTDPERPGSFDPLAAALTRLHARSSWPLPPVRLST